MSQTVLQCRELLEATTPLRSDCGALCGAACCASLEGEETGMLLFPGEEALYADRPGWRIRPCAMGRLLICPGRCDRADRPLSCRLFPALPLLREDGVRVAMDARAAAVCPLAKESPRSLSPEFIDAVRTCGRLLAEDPEQRPFLLRLTEEHDAYRQLQLSFR